MTRRSRTRRSGEAGFTLLELLVAFTVLGLILAALSGSVRFASQAFERGSAIIADAQALAVAGDLLRRQAGRAFPLSVDTADGARFLFTGAPRRLSFPVVEPPEPGSAGAVGAGLRLAAFAIEPAADGDRLVYRLYRFQPAATVEVVEPPSRSAVLAEGPYRFAFDYAGPAGWTETWAEATDLPHLARLRVRDAAGREAWPAVVVRLGLDGDRGCLGENAGLCRERSAP